MARRLLLRDRRLACETERKLDVVDPDAGRPVLAVLTDRTTGPHRVKVGRWALAVVALCVLAAVILLGTPVGALAQGEPATAGEPRAAETPAAAEAPTAVEGETHEAAEHEEGLLPGVARLVNFAILIGTLVYLLRSPLATYLKDRGTQIRSDLINAAELKRTAAAQLEEIDRKMKALPGELEALRAQGAQEIAAEETRIRAAAAAERDRLLEQARRDIDQHVKVAERELVNHAADLAVGVAAERIKRSITDDDQRRLADRYVQQLKGAADGQR
jgi:F-type H+-transporting ATPase subunit b